MKINILWQYSCLCDILRLEELSVMTDVVTSAKKLPEQLHRRINSDRVRYHENKKVITLTPINEPEIDIWGGLEELRAIFSDGRMSTQKFMEQ